MNGNISFHPAFKWLIEAAAELDKERTQAAAILGRGAYQRVEAIIEAQPIEKRAAFYGTITEAALGGSDFSTVETIDDIGSIYARFIIGRAFGG